jgi:hypothetical protein
VRGGCDDKAWTAPTPQHSATGCSGNVVPAPPRTADEEVVVHPLIRGLCELKLVIMVYEYLPMHELHVCLIREILPNVCNVLEMFAASSGRSYSVGAPDYNDVYTVSTTLAAGYRYENLQVFTDHLAKSGDVDALLQMLTVVPSTHAHWADVTKSCMQFGTLKMVDLIFRSCRSGMTVSPCAVDWAVQAKRTDIVDFCNLLCRHVPLESRSHYFDRHTANVAAQSGDLETLKYLVRDHGCGVDSDVYTEAVRSGCVLMCKWLREQGCETSRQADVVAVEGKNPEMADTVLQAHLDDSRLWSTAALTGSIAVCDVLLRHSATWYPYHFGEAAIEKGHLHLIIWAVGKKLRMDMRRVLEHALICGNLAIAMWARSRLTSVDTLASPVGESTAKEDSDQSVEEDSDQSVEEDSDESVDDGERETSPFLT